MVIRRHGIIGGPRQRPPVSRKVQQKPIVKKHTVDVIVVDSSDVDVVVIEPEDEEIFDEILEEDKLEVYTPDDLFEEFVCECGFVAKSERGLKSHKRWKHLITEDSELKQEE